MRWICAFLLVLTCPWAMEGEEPFNVVSEQCTVRFDDIPLSYSDLREVGRFDSTSHQSIRRLSPSEEGLFLVRVDSLDRTPIYSSYWAEERKSRVQTLPSSFGALTERRVTEPSDPDLLEADVVPGYYRVVLRYYPPESEEASSKERRRRRKAKRVLLCEAISPAMELEQEFTLFLFK